MYILTFAFESYNKVYLKNTYRYIYAICRSKYQIFVLAYISYT